jgi:nitrogen-specific signal transduction histidine kinase
VFARCAQNLATLYERLQVAAQAQFFRRHYQQIHRLEEQVSQILVSAEQLIKADSAG